MGGTQACSAAQDSKPNVCGCGTEAESAPPLGAVSMRDVGDSDAAEDEPPIAVPSIAPPVCRSGISGRLVIDFRRTDGSECTIDFEDRQPPLGIDFSTSIPVTVKLVKPDSHAMAMGILPGWAVLSINGESVLGWQPNAVFAKLSRAVTVSIRSTQDGDSSWPSDWSAIWIFRAEDGTQRQVNFRNRSPPFGMEFEMTPSMRVKRIVPGGHAAELGVGIGWAVESINGRSIEDARGRLSPRSLLVTSAGDHVPESAGHREAIPQPAEYIEPQLPMPAEQTFTLFPGQVHAQEIFANGVEAIGAPTVFQGLAVGGPPTMAHLPAMAVASQVPVHAAQCASHFPEVNSATPAALRNTPGRVQWTRGATSAFGQEAEYGRVMSSPREDFCPYAMRPTFGPS